jgi:hypothetical protein
MKVDAGGCFRPTADPCNKVPPSLNIVRLGSPLETGMRTVILACVLGLAMAASAQAAPLSPKPMKPVTYLP